MKDGRSLSLWALCVSMVEASPGEFRASERVPYCGEADMWKGANPTAATMLGSDASAGRGRREEALERTRFFSDCDCVWHNKTREERRGRSV